jgi:hypothetical protein
LGNVAQSMEASELLCLAPPALQRIDQEIGRQCCDCGRAMLYSDCSLDLHAPSSKCIDGVLPASKQGTHIDTFPWGPLGSQDIVSGETP